MTTLIHIEVHQSTDEGEARIIAGGIGQRKIRFEVIAKKTTYFNYNVTLYGIKDFKMDF